jgi:two-component system, LytTR family, response regulator
MTIRALIVDDEPLARRGLLRFLKNDPEVEIVAECADGESAVSTILRKKPDLVFLDVHMPEMDGLGVVRTVGLSRMPVTIFVTAYDRYALRAFEVNAIDYLLKPIARERFIDALTRAKRRIAEKSQSDLNQNIKAMLERLHCGHEYVEHLSVPQNGRIVLVRAKEIDWIEAKGNYARLHVGAWTHEIRETLNTLERKLDPREFLRIHRSTIVNIRAIKEIQPWFHGYHLMLLQNGQELRMSRYQNKIAQQLGVRIRRPFRSTSA